ncbi:MAG TPA: phosphatase domain-containing protein [Longimicrobiaceae bacterium]|nr:phosphatase domain-containing protein [Longimicrobiaceae bacterium]
MPDPNAINRTPDPQARPGWKLRLEDRLGLLDPVQILVFRSFGTPELVRIRGRVRERKGVAGTTEESSFWQNVSNTLHRLESDEIPGARVRARLGGRTLETTTDEEGYFSLELEPEEPLTAGWHEVELELVESVGRPACRTVRGRVLVPSPDAEFGVISDVDDTIIRTRSNDLLREIEIVFGKGARDRVAFPGVPALYRAFSRGPDDQGDNPVFYVSMSGWNLYDLLEEFMRMNDIPEGPLFLSDLRLVEKPSEVMGSARHKWESIDLLMRTYPELPFVLVGDSGMHDPQLYREVAERHPGRVRAVYVHDVSPPERDDEVDRIARELEGHGVPLLRMENTVRAAEHAHEIGLISADGLEEVRREVRRQERGGDGPGSD